jgi:hypothetical protein
MGYANFSIQLCVLDEVIVLTDAEEVAMAWGSGGVVTNRLPYDVTKYQTSRQSDTFAVHSV